MAKGIVDGAFKLVISEVINRPDPQQILARICDERTSQTVETIRDALMEAMGLKPDFKVPIDELADAVLACQDGRYNTRVQQAIFKLFETVSTLTAVLADIKSDTSQIPSIKTDTAATREDVAQITAAVLGSAGSQGEPSSAASTLRRQLLVETLTAELRDLRDSEGRQRWSEINEAIARHSWKRVFALSQEMEQWLDAQGDKLSSDIKGQALLMLSDVALIRYSGLPWEASCNTSEAWRILNRAEVVLGSVPSEDNSQRLLRVRAKLIFIDGNHEAALQLLTATTGPATIALHIAFLVEQKRFTDASDLAAQQPEPHKRWADDAIVAHIRATYHERAEALLKWTEQQALDVRQACVLAFARETYSEITDHGSPASLVEQQESQIIKLRDLLNRVSHTFSSALQYGPDSGINAEAMELLILLSHVLRDRAVCQLAADSLLRWEPTSPELGRAVLRGDIAPIAGLSDRYLKDNPAVFMFQMLVGMLLTEAEGKPDRALAFLRPLLPQMAETPHQEEVGTAILIAAQRCSRENANEALHDLEQVFGQTHRLAAMLRASLLADTNDLLAASSELATVADEQDYVWLQLAAGVAVKREDWPSAAGYFRKVGTATGRAEAYSNEAQSWYRAGDIAKAVEALESANRLEPHQPKTLHNLAAAYHNLGRYRNAASIYSQSWNSEPRDEGLALNYASCLALSGNAANAVTLLKEYIDANQNTVSAELLIMRAHLLVAMGNPTDALDSLLPHWERLSTDHRYLMQMFQLGYAANREQHAHEAMNMLLAMQRAGQLPQPVFQQYTLDDMLEMHHGWIKQRQTINQQYLTGRLPWIIASHWVQPSGHCLLSWRIRTQHAVPRDHPDDLAEFSIYSTNGFTIRNIDGERHLDRLHAAETGATIVADVSALITLHRLGLLHTLGTRFAKVLVPLSYKSIWIEEQARIPHHQPKQIKTRQSIVTAVRDGKIAIITKDKIEADVPILDEYDKPASQDKPVVRILQIARWMASHGKLASQDLNRIETMQHEPERLTAAQAEKLLDSGKLLATTFTLQTVNDWGLLDSLSAGIRVMVEQDDVRELETELRNQALCDEAGGWHIQLVQAIDQLPNVEYVGLSSRDTESRAHADIHYGIDAALLAIEHNLPLLVDDRYCQQGRLSASGAKPEAAFGTDCFLEQLIDGKIVDAEQHADFFLQLIEWRYKFCLPTTSILLTLAHRFKDGSPGMQLRHIAAYMQDCMRDVGLFGGQEPTEPPTPMALKLFNAWIDVVAEFLVRLWQDPRFNELQAAKITKWAARYFRPAWPKNMVAASWRTISHLAVYSLLGGVVTHLLQQADTRKANRLINRMRRSMGISKEDMAATHEYVVTSMSSIPVSDEHNRLIVGSIFLRVHDILYGHHSSVDWRLLPIAEALDIVSLDDVPTDRFVEAVSDRNHAARLEPKVGPYAYVQEEPRPRASRLTDMLCAATGNLRRAALDNLIAADRCPKSPRTQAMLDNHASAIQSESACQWVPAVSSLLDSINEDFELNVAGFEQTRARQHVEGQVKSWQRLISPTPECLLAIERDGWRLLPHSGEATAQPIETLKDASTLDELIRTYDDAVGHLALASPLDLGTRIRDYIGAHGNIAALWPTLEPWIYDKTQPWHQYHACQALLANLDSIPAGKGADVWEEASHIAEILEAQQYDSDEAQVWRLERDLAAHYLRILDVSGYALDESRLITVCWWAARRVSELLIHGVPIAQLPAQVREWRENAILRGTLLIHDTWAWLAPKAYSPCRFALLFSISPLSSAILLAAGKCAATDGVSIASNSVRESLRNSYCVALLTTDVHGHAREPRLWAWDDSLIEAAEHFMSALPSEEQTEAAAQTIRIVKGLSDTQGIKAALEQLPSTKEIDAVFVCNRVRMFCHDHAEAADLLLGCLRDKNWRDSCAANVPLMGWELLAQGLLFLQTRQGVDWAVELPYAFLRAAEATSSDSDRAEVFIRCLIMSSLSGGTTCAIKLLKQSKELPALQDTIRLVRESIENLRGASRSNVAIRLQDVCTALDQV